MADSSAVDAPLPFTARTPPDAVSLNGHPILATMFVYGTLRPGEERWPMLSPFVVDEGWDDAVAGRLYDTGLGYPAATFDTAVAPATGTAGAAAAVRAGLVVGRTVRLLEASLRRALAVIDTEEDTAAGLYRRVAVTTRTGVRAWAYQWAARVDLAPIVSGDWCRR